MAYSNFTLEQVIDQFQLTASTTPFTIQPIVPSSELEATRKRYLPLATSISTEKARWVLMANVIFSCRRTRTKRWCKPRSWSWWKPRMRTSREGLGQCAAQMVGAQAFNQRRGHPHAIYGAVTTGTNWKLLTLQQQQINISLDEYLVPPQLPTVVGFLAEPFQAIFA